MHTVTRTCLRLLLMAGLMLPAAALPADAPPPVTPAIPAAVPQSAPNVFDMPQVQAVYVQMEREMLRLFRTRDYRHAAMLLEQWLDKAPGDPTSWYNLGCAQARLGDTANALRSLANAVRWGFANADFIEKDEDLVSLHDAAEFKKLVGDLRLAAAAPGGVRPLAKGCLAVDGVVQVTEANTRWDAPTGLFRVAFELPPKAALTGPVISGQGEAGALVTRWYGEGSAAGNYGDFYDNHDDHHSELKCADFPQLTRIAFGEAARARRLHTGLQATFAYSGVVLGNSSTALTSDLIWRSLPRLAMVDHPTMLRLYTQYVSNHLYFYPEHKDYAPGHNGKGDGYGDTYPANCPYFIVSQGSSFSDQPFMHAAACTLAAFRPETKEALVSNGLLMPTVQMLFRFCSKTVATPQDYLTGKAHPPVFTAENLDPVAMVTMAHSMPKDAVPPLVQLKVVEEDRLRPGLDYVDNGAREFLFETPGAIARLFRSTRYERRMVVSAEASRDLNHRPLTFSWRVLCGDEKRIRIRPLNDAGSVAEIIIPWHERFPIAPGAKMESNRVDIGVFAHNGTYYSAPAFVSCAFADNEKRQYDDAHRLQVLDYRDPAVAANYVDPLLEQQKSWRDEFHYDTQGRLTGWSRTPSHGEPQSFTADGALVQEKDALGRPVRAQSVFYTVVPRENWIPYLDPRPGDEIRTYSYTDDKDPMGIVKSRTKIPPPAAPEPEL